MADAPGAAPVARCPPLIVLVVISGLAFFSTHIIVPSMPAIAVAFDTTYGTVQLVLTVYLFGFAGAQLVYGPLSDRFGRRPVLLVGLLLYITGTLTCLFAPIVEVMIAGRLVQAIGGCSGMIMARAIVRDVYDREGSATTLASVLTAAALGPMVAPLIGGYLQAWFGWQANFMVLLAAGIGILIACWFLLNETLGERRPMASPIDMVLDFAKLMRFPSFWGYTCQPAFNAAVFFAFVGGAPYVLVEILGRPPPPRSSASTCCPFRACSWPATLPAAA